MAASGKVKYLKRDLTITSIITSGVGPYTYTVTAPSHFIKTADTVYVYEYVNVSLPFVVTVVDANTFTFTSTVKYDNISKATITAQFYSAGQTGRQAPFTFQRGTGAALVVQSHVTGTGAATYNLEASMDAIHWFSLGTVTHTGVTDNAQFSTVGPAWAYGVINITSIGAATSLTVIVGNG